MGITYDAARDMIVVTGGSNAEPYTMAKLKASATSGSYIATGGFGGNVYTLSANLEVGSEDCDTFFDLVGSVAQTDSTHTMAFYSTALRGGRSVNTWADRLLQGVARPSRDACKMRIVGVIRAYCKRTYHQCPFTGDFIREESAGSGRSYDPHSETPGGAAMGLKPGAASGNMGQGNGNGSVDVCPDIFCDIGRYQCDGLPEGSCQVCTTGLSRREGGEAGWGPAATDLIFEVSSWDRAK